MEGSVGATANHRLGKFVEDRRFSDFRGWVVDLYKIYTEGHRLT